MVMGALSNPFANTAIALIFADIVANEIAILLARVAAPDSADQFAYFGYPYAYFGYPYAWCRYPYAYESSSSSSPKSLLA